MMFCLYLLTIADDMICVNASVQISKDEWHNMKNTSI